jgi:ABC-type multidrug transport system ATPase subunit
VTASGAVVGADGAVVIEADGLGKSFGRHVVLKAASFRARRGTVTALMGLNGAGKSTMLKIAVGIVRPDYGRVLLCGEFLERPRLASLASRGLFYSAQDSALTDLFTVEEQLGALAEVYGREDALGGVIEHLRLNDLVGRTPSSLSGGEQQRAALAMASIRDPSCLLMDEPFAGVAPKDRPLVHEGLVTLRDRGCAVVISGHDFEDLFEVADEIVWVVAGTSHVLGSPERAAGHDQFRREYLGPRRATSR